MGLPSSPACPGSHPWGFFRQARKVHSEHQCLFLLRPCVIMTMTTITADNVPGTPQLVTPINANLRHRDEVHVGKF